MSQERLSALSILHFHKKMTKLLDPAEVMRLFVHDKPERILVFGGSKRKNEGDK
jgi:hypothetical protein